MNEWAAGSVRSAVKPLGGRRRMAARRSMSRWGPVSASAPASASTVERYGARRSPRSSALIVLMPVPAAGPTLPGRARSRCGTGAERTRNLPCLRCSKRLHYRTLGPCPILPSGFLSTLSMFVWAVAPSARPTREAIGVRSVFQRR
jgi:hypothetical protein